MLTGSGVTLEEITGGNRAAVLALRVAPGQEQFVSSVPQAPAEAAEYPHAKPWYRTVVADGTPVGFVMVSWNAEPQPPEIIGPWFLWKLLIGERYQGRGYAAEVFTAACTSPTRVSGPAVSDQSFSPAAAVGTAATTPAATSRSAAPRRPGRRRRPAGPTSPTLRSAGRSASGAGDAPGRCR